jgi:hypothetical protein
LSKPSVFVGYIATKDEAAAQPKPGASGPSEPNFTPAPWAPPPGVPVWPFPVGVPVPYPNSTPAPWAPR